MNQSESINELVAALAKAQGEMEPAKFNKKGHKHQYADFTSVMHSCRIPLSSNNLAIMQYVETIDKQHVLVTMLTHTSGQWIKSHLPLLMNEATCQALGSSMTYMKRYGLSALLGIVSDADEGADDDGETASGRGKPQPNNQNYYQNNKPQEQEKAPLTQRMGKSEFIVLNTLMQSLDEESRRSFLDWIKKDFNASSLQEIPQNHYEKCMISLNAKIKFLKDQEKSIKVAV